MKGKRWKYRVVYQSGDGAMALYFTDNRRDAWSKARALGGHVEELPDAYWSKS